MKVFTDKDIRRLFAAVAVVMTAFLLLSELIIWLSYKTFSLSIVLLFLFMSCVVFIICFRFFSKQNKML